MTDDDALLQPRSGSIWRTPWPWAVLAGLIFIPAMRPLLRHVPDPPPVIGQVPDFSLTDSRGAPFGTAEMDGRVWVVDFFFTRCQTICPHLTAAMAGLDRRYREAGVEGIGLLSISIDPDHDSPRILAAYGERHGVDPGRWKLVTGRAEDVRDLVVGGFGTAVGEVRETAPGLIDIAHTGRFALVDRDGGIRGFYGIDASGLDEVFHRSRHVLAE